MKKADKKIWNNLWDKQRTSISISDLEYTIFKEIQKLIDFKRKEVLELGCGRGVLSFLMLKNGAKSATLVDFSKTALNLACKYFGSEDNVKFINSDLFEIDESKKYNIVFSSGVAEHFSDKLREDVIHKHLRMTNDITVLIVPARPHFNTIRHRKKMVVALYGWQYSFSKKEINNIVNKFNGHDIVVSRRFYPLYGINLFEWFGIDSKIIYFHIWGFFLKVADRIFNKIKFYSFLDMLLSPFSHKIGGLLIIVIKRNVNRV